MMRRERIWTMDPRLRAHKCKLSKSSTSSDKRWKRRPGVLPMPLPWLVLTRMRMSLSLSLSLTLRSIKHSLLSPISTPYPRCTFLLLWRRCRPDHRISRGYRHGHCGRPRFACSTTIQIHGSRSKFGFNDSIHQPVIRGFSR